MAAESSRVLWGWTAPARVLLALLAVACAIALLRIAAADGEGRTGTPLLVVDPNTAPPQVLGALPRIGPALAGRIVAARRQAPLRSIDDLDERVPRIGPATVEALRPHLRFDAQPARARRAALGPVADGSPRAH